MEIGKPVTEDLISLLKKIDEQSIKLPEFQRDFRWDISNLSELIQSLMRGFPAGVMLFWDGISAVPACPDPEDSRGGI